MCNHRRWGCWLETPRDDLARAPDHFNHSSPLTGSQLSICSQESRRALTNHLPSLLLPAPHFCLSAMMTQWKKTEGRKKYEIDLFVSLFLRMEPPPSSLSRFFSFFSANWNQLAGQALVVGNVGQARSNKKVLTFLWLYAAWKGCRGLVQHERSSINFTYFTQALVRRP